jgi:hypothetical protein
VPTLVREANRTFPTALVQLDAFVPPWVAEGASAAPAALAALAAQRTGCAPPAAGPVTTLLGTHAAAALAVGALLGYGTSCVEPDPLPGGDPVPADQVTQLVARFPEATRALAMIVGRD